MSPNFLLNLLNIGCLTEVVDIGANPIDGDPPYKAMLAEGLCRVTGFEPQAQALEKLRARCGPHERYLPYAVGDGKTHELKVCRASGMTSLLEPDVVTLALFNELLPCADVLERVPVNTRRLDEIDEIERIDLLKIDIQGGELVAIREGAEKLVQVVAVQTEVSFVTLYEGQPSFGELDHVLRGLGLIPHCFADIKKWPISPCVVNGNPRQPLNQLLEADMVYVRDFTRPDAMSDEQLKHLALIAHACYGSFDLSLRCILLLEQRGAISAGGQQAYIESLASAAG